VPALPAAASRLRPGFRGEAVATQPREEVPGVLEALHAVRALGARLALDDLGTG
jgi:EAL domain-containing protein (putative c-di-GMP-specific phosphodiesterase class I)